MTKQMSAYRESNSRNLNIALETYLLLKQLSKKSGVPMARIIQRLVMAEAARKPEVSK